jgi:outer membrane protein, heavy metal efflux system
MACIYNQLTPEMKKVCHLIHSSRIGGDVSFLKNKPTFLILGFLFCGVIASSVEAQNLTGMDATVTPTATNSGTVSENPDDLGPVQLSLEQAVEEGIKHNLDLMAAKYNIPIAEANELTASLPGNPALILDTALQPFGGNWNQTNAGGPVQYDAGLSLPLDLSNKYGTGKKDAQAATAITKAQFKDTVRQKILLIRQDYINVVTQQHNVALYKERADNYEKLVHVIQNRIGIVKAQPLLLMRAQLARDQALINLRQNENSLRSTKTLLAIQLGRSPLDTAFEATTELRPSEMVNPLDKEAVIAQALENRPDLKAVQLTQEKAKLDRRLAEDQAWDDITVTAQVTEQGAVDSQDSSGSLPAAYSWGLALNVPFPLLNQNQGLTKVADLTGQQAQKQVESLNLSIRQEIGDELAQLKIDHELIEEYETTQIRNARKVRDEQQKLFGTGNMNLLDYFDAMEAYNTVLFSYYATVGSYRNDLAMIDASVGKDILP